MPPKRKVPLAIADANADNVSPAKKPTIRKTAMVSQEPVPVTFLLWPNDDEEESEDEEDEEDDDIEFDDPRPEPGSLQEQLDIIENERNMAYTEAFNAYVKEKRCISSKEVDDLRKKICAPFKKRADQAREAFVKAGLMTVDEAKAIQGVSEEDRKVKRRSKRDFQERLNDFQRECNAAIDKALEKEKAGSITHTEAQARITKAEEKLSNKIKKAKEGVVQWASTRLKVEDAKDMQPNIKLDENGKEIPKPKSVAQLREEAEKAAFVPPRVVTDEGLPVSKAGMKKAFEIRKEVDMRDPDLHAMYIYNDFAGYGITEVMDNVLAEFNKVIFKKEVSAIEKWTIVEGLVTYLYMEDHTPWMINDNPDAIQEVLNMFGIMYITALEMLHESNLLPTSSTTPLPDNIGIMTLLLLNFFTTLCTDFHLPWLHEIVRAAGKYGVILTIPSPERISITQLQLERWRAESRVTKGLAWKGKYQRFKKEHPGGKYYDITQMSAAEKAKYKFSGASDSGSGEDDDDDDE